MQDAWRSCARPPRGLALSRAALPGRPPPPLPRRLPPRGRPGGPGRERRQESSERRQWMPGYIAGPPVRDEERRGSAAEPRDSHLYPASRTHARGGPGSRRGSRPRGVSGGAFRRPDGRPARRMRGPGARRRPGGRDGCPVEEPLDAACPGGGRRRAGLRAQSPHPVLRLAGSSRPAGPPVIASPPLGGRPGPALHRLHRNSRVQLAGLGGLESRLPPSRAADGGALAPPRPAPRRGERLGRASQRLDLPAPPAARGPRRGDRAGPAGPGGGEATGPGPAARPSGAARHGVPQRGRPPLGRHGRVAVGQASQGPPHGSLLAGRVLGRDRRLGDRARGDLRRLPRVLRRRAAGPRDPGSRDPRQRPRGLRQGAHGRHRSLLSRQGPRRRPGGAVHAAGGEGQHPPHQALLRAVQADRARLPRLLAGHRAGHPPGRGLHGLLDRAQAPQPREPGDSAGRVRASRRRRRPPAQRPSRPSRHGHARPLLRRGVRRVRRRARRRDSAPDPGPAGAVAADTAES